MISPVVRIFDETPDTFAVAVNNGILLCSEWRASITQAEDGHYHALCYFRLTSEAATYENAVKELMACRYREDQEVALMRKGIADPEDADYLAHEEYATQAKAFAASLGLPREDEEA